MNDKPLKKADVKSFPVVMWWKLHVDTGDYLPPEDFPPKDCKTKYFKVEGKERPAIVWRCGATHTLLIMLTRTFSQHVIRLGKLKNANDVSHFDPRRIESYPNKLKSRNSRYELTNDQLQLLLEEIDRYSMKSKPISLDAK